MQTKLLLTAAASLGLGLVLAAGSVQAQTQPEAVSVDVASSKLVRVGASVTRVSVGSSEIADVKAFRPDQMLVTGRRPGATTATVWSASGVKVYQIRVNYPRTLMLRALRKALPGARGLDVSTAGSSVVLSGKVPSAADVPRAEKIIKGLVAGVLGSGEVPVVNMLRVPGNQQVQLEVSFAEVSRSALRSVGFNFWSKHARSSGKGYAGGITSPTTGMDVLSPEVTNPDIGNLNHGPTGFDPDTGAQVGAGTVPLVSAPVSGAFGFIFSSTLGGFPFSAALSLLSRKGYSRTLAEPTLVALNGKKAQFLAGGEFPIPLPQSLGQIAVEYRKFGIQLSFTPTVVGKDIQLNLAMTVSDVDQSLGVRLASTTVPGLTSRHSQTTIRLRDGQSFVIAGLLSDKVRSAVDKVPFLGDVPILGTLFRSSSYRRDETELLVVVTANLVRPLNKRPTLPGEFSTSDPSDLELFLLGKHESIDTGAESPRRKRRRRKRNKPVGAVGFKR
jgi:pilus assembly protein CpaC